MKRDTEVQLIQEHDRVPVATGDRLHVIATPLLMTRDEVATALQVPADTVTHLHRDGQLCGVRIGKHLRWRPEDVHAFVQGLGDDRGAVPV